jgi:uncharacterized protein with HEPN domain
VRRDLQRLDDILESAELVAEQVRRGREHFLASRSTRAAVERFIEIIGEAAGRMSPELRAAHPEIPWAEIVGMRNRLVHAYFDVDPDILWDAATIEVPMLAHQIAAILDRD